MTKSQKLANTNKQSCLANLCEIIHNKVLSNNGRIPYGYMSTLIKENQNDFEWLTRDMVNSAYSRQKKKKRLGENLEKDQPTILQIRVDKKKSSSSLHTSLSGITNKTVCISGSTTKNDDGMGNDTPSVVNCDNGGRLVGATQIHKRKRDEMIVSMKNVISEEYVNELEAHKKKGKG